MKVCGIRASVAATCSLVYDGTFSNFVSHFVQRSSVHDSHSAAPFNSAFVDGTGDFEVTLGRFSLVSGVRTPLALCCRCCCRRHRHHRASSSFINLMVKVTLTTLPNTRVSKGVPICGKRSCLGVRWRHSRTRAATCCAHALTTDKCLAQPPVERVRVRVRVRARAPG